MMEEMVRIREASAPDEVLLVVDSMIGQEAADLTRAFHEQVGISPAPCSRSWMVIPAEGRRSRSAR
jgi:signal recognition particle GTPase